MEFIDFLKDKNFKNIKKWTKNIYSFRNDEREFIVFCKEDLLENEKNNFEYEFDVSDEKQIAMEKFIDFENFDFVVCNFAGRFFLCREHLEKFGYYIIDIEKEFDLLGCKEKMISKFVPLNNSIYGLSKGRNFEVFKNYIYTRNMIGAGICDDNLMFSLQYFKDVKDKFKPIISRVFETKFGKVSLFARNYNGYKNLMFLNYYESFLFMKKGIKVIPTKILLKYNEDLIGILNTYENFVLNNVLDLEKSFNNIKELYEYSFIGIEYYNCVGEEDKFRKNVIEPILKNKFEKDVIYFNLSCYTNPIEEKSYKFLSKISNPNFFDDRKLHILDYEDIISLFEKIVDENFLRTMLINTIRISHLTNLIIPLSHYDLPLFDCQGDKIKLFEKIIQQGIKKKLVPLFKKKLIDKDEYLKRIKYEKEVILSSNFVDYFLIIWDIVKWAKDNGIYTGVARGSVAGSLIAYVMDITGVDSIKFDLLFERFLNKARFSGERAKSGDALPDIDMDFESRKRDDVKNYILQKYGLKSCCSIGSFGKLQVRSAIKDIGKIFGLSFDYINQITRRIQGNELKNLFDSASKDKEVFIFLKENPHLLEVVFTILSLPKSSSIHPAGMIIVPKGKKLWEYVPVRWVRDDVSEKGWSLITEWEGKHIDARGILKIDVLGIKQLDIFKDIENLILERYKKKVSFDEVITNDLHNKKVYKEFQNGTEAVFQFKSPGLKTYMKLLKPDDFEDLVAANALYRPGSKLNNFHIKYVKIKQGDEDVYYDNELLKFVTEKTYGLYIYQEQIMQAVVTLGNLSMEEADIIRTSIKKFDKEKMSEFKDRFIVGAMKNGCSKEQSEEIWNKLLAFSGYGFNKSHSCSYSMLGYYCQWLKVHFPLEFFTVNLNFSNDDYINELIFKLKDFGIEFTLPDINRSDLFFVSDYKIKKIFWSLSKIKGVGEKAAKDIVLARKKVGKFKSFEHFLKNVKKSLVNKRVVLNLIFSGAFDNMFGIKNKVLNRMNIIKEYFKFRKEEIKMEDYIRTNFFFRSKQAELLNLRNFYDFDRFVKKRNLDYDPLSMIRITPQNSIVNFIGIVVGRRVFKTKKGQEMMVITLENNGEQIDVVVFPYDYSENKIRLEKVSFGDLFYCSAKKSFDHYRQKENLLLNKFFKIFKKR